MSNLCKVTEVNGVPVVGEGVPLERLHKLGLYKHLNAQTLGYAGDPNEEADRLNNPL